MQRHVETVSARPISSIATSSTSVGEASLGGRLLDDSDPRAACARSVGYSSSRYAPPRSRRSQPRARTLVPRPRYTIASPRGGRTRRSTHCAGWPAPRPPCAQTSCQHVLEDDRGGERLARIEERGQVTILSLLAAGNMRALWMATAAGMASSEARRLSSSPKWRALRFSTSVKQPMTLPSKISGAERVARLAPLHHQLAIGRIHDVVISVGFAALAVDEDRPVAVAVLQSSHGSPASRGRPGSSPATQAAEAMMVWLSE